MTGEELIEILGEHLENTAGMNEAVHYILAALAKEREGEVVLEEGRMNFRCDQCGIVSTLGADTIEKETRLRANQRILGKRGQLIFRPAKGDR